MPIYEFRCLNCQKLFEMLVMSPEDSAAAKCPHCDGTASERVLSTTNYSMPGGGGQRAPGPSAQTRNCATGSCTTYNIPGPD